MKLFLTSSVAGENEKKDLIEKVEEFYRLSVPSSREQESYFTHVDGVRRYALLLANEYCADEEVVEIAALLHDTGADSGKVHAFKSAETADEFLTNLNVDNLFKTKIISAIKNHSMSQSSETFNEEVPMEDRVIRDADGLSFIENSYKSFLQKGIELHGDIEIAKKESIDKINGMTKKITTAKGKAIAESLKDKAFVYISNQKE